MGNLSEYKEYLDMFHLNEKELKGCCIKTFPFGKKLMKQADLCENLFIVLNGKAKVGKASSNGKDLILCFYISEGLMGDMELFSKTHEVYSSVTVVDELTCIQIPLKENEGYLMHNLEFVRTAAFELSKKLHASAENVIESTLYTAEVRLCRYILDAEERGTFRDIMKDVASSVGVSYRHLYRMMAKLCDEGVLEKKESGYKILDYSSLKAKGRE